jgi:hypothetical protein
VSVEFRLQEMAASPGIPPIACGQHAVELSVAHRSFGLPVDSFDCGRNDANVSAELENQVVDIRRRDVASIDGRRVRVRSLEALDGTPILDVKPVFSRSQPL